MIQIEDDGNKNNDIMHQEDGGIIKQIIERHDEKGMLKIQQNQKRRNSSREASPSSSFENRIAKRYNPSSTEFKVHFYVRRVNMNGMNENEFLSFIKRKVNLAGSCDVVQLFNQQNQYCDIAIGMSNDDNAKLVYIGKKHFNFGRSCRQKESIELSDAFKNYLENKKMIDKDHLERQLRRNQQSKGRSESSDSSRRYKSRSTSKKRRKSKIEKFDLQKEKNKKKSSYSSSSERKNKKKRRHSSPSSSRSRISIGKDIQPIKPQQVFSDKNTIYIFSIPLEFSIQDIVDEISGTYKLSTPISTQWNTFEKMQYLEVQFQDENTAFQLVAMRPCFHVKGIPLLVIPKKQRPVQELLRNYEVQVEVDKDVPAYNMYWEFKKYGDLIGIYVFQANRNYLLLYSSSSQLQEGLRPPVQLQLHINEQLVQANARIIDKPIDIQRPQMKETLAYQLLNSANSALEEDDDYKKKKSRKYKSVDKNFKK